MLSRALRLASKNGPRPSPSAYQLWLDDFGDNPNEVNKYLLDQELIQDPLTSAVLPWLVLELPAGTDTFNLLAFKAEDLNRLGANNRIEEIADIE